MSEQVCVEVCAGAGGQLLGLERAGFFHEVAVELDPDAATTLRMNRPGIDIRQGDAADPQVWKPTTFAGTDLLAGGVPCQPFTVAGRQQGENDQRDMLGWAIDVVGEIRPRAVMLENVRGLRAAKFTEYRARLIGQLIDWGYHGWWNLIDAKDYGVPQTRTRLVLVALQGRYASKFVWPQPTGVPVSTVGETCKDLMAARGWDQAEQWALNANRIAPTIVGGSKQHGGPDLGPTRARREWAAMGVNGAGIADWAPEPGWRPEFPITGPKLTHEMVVRLQGWNDGEWVFAGKKTSRHQQVGNAFPPPAAEAFGRAIKTALES